jgi:large subunit ribosomal protein L4e
MAETKETVAKKEAKKAPAEVKEHAAKPAHAHDAKEKAAPAHAEHKEKPSAEAKRPEERKAEGKKAEEKKAGEKKVEEGKPAEGKPEHAKGEKHEAKEHAEKPKKREEKHPAWTGPTSSVKVNVYSLDGKAKGKIALPRAFDTPLRSDLIQAAVTRSRANRRQIYGPNPRSGQRHSVEQWGKGHGVARVQRVKGERRGAQSPNNMGGRRAHPPTLNKIWDRKMNAKERRLARMSALSAMKDAALVKARGHRFLEELTLPVVVEEDFERMQDEVKEGYTGSMIETLGKLGVYVDVERATEGTHERAGKGKLRGRRFRTPTSLLIVVSDVESVRPFVRNLPGVEVVSPGLLSIERLAPGGTPGRLTLISVQALESMMGW